MDLASPGKVVACPPNPAQSRPSVNRGSNGEPASPDYDIFSCLVRDDVYGTQDEGLLVGTGLGPPIVGRLAGSGTMLGLRDSLDKEFQTVPRGANGYAILGGMYRVWESSFHFAQGRRLLRLRPRVCLVSANRYQLPVTADSSGQSLADRISARYAEIEQLRIQVILDESRNWHYNPFLMGLPLRQHTSPFGGSSPPPYDAHQLLTVHFWPNDFGPQGATPGSGGTGGATTVVDSVTGDRAYTEVFGSYFHYKAATTGFGPPTPSSYVEFQLPANDTALFTAEIPRFRSRRHVVHPARFDDGPVRWAAAVAAPSVVTFGSRPHPYGDAFADALVGGMQMGRSYAHEPARDGVTSTSDLCDALFEDIHAFFD